MAFGAVALSSDTILKQAKEALKATFPCSMQLNEVTDVSQCAQLHVYVRYTHVDAIK